MTYAMIVSARSAGVIESVTRQNEEVMAEGSAVAGPASPRTKPLGRCARVLDEPAQRLGLRRECVPAIVRQVLVRTSRGHRAPFRRICLATRARSSSEMGPACAAALRAASAAVIRGRPLAVAVRPCPRCARSSLAMASSASAMRARSLRGGTARWSRRWLAPSRPVLDAPDGVVRPSPPEAGMRKTLAIAAIIGSLTSGITLGVALGAEAHGGGLNRCGCRVNRRTGDCHCHQDRGCGCACQPDRCE